MSIGQSLYRFLGSQPVGDINHKPSGRLPLLSTRSAVTFPSKEITPHVPNYTAWSRRHTGVSSLPKARTMVPSQDLNPRAVNRKSNALSENGKMMGKATWGRKRIQLFHDVMEGRDYGQLRGSISHRSRWRQDSK